MHEIERSWFEFRYVIGLVALIVVVVIFAPKFVSLFVQSKNYAMVIIIPWLLYVFYFILAHLFNTSRVELGGRYLVLKQSPFPLQRIKRYAIEQISDIGLRVKENQGRSLRTVYDIVLKLKNNTAIPLEKNIEAYDQARYMVQMIRENLEKQWGNRFSWDPGVYEFPEG